jgi:hypothetical protein
MPTGIAPFPELPHHPVEQQQQQKMNTKMGFVNYQTMAKTPPPKKNSFSSDEGFTKEEEEGEVRHFRRVAFLAVALSTVTMLSCVVVMPIAYQCVS